jgi:integrase
VAVDTCVIEKQKILEIPKSAPHDDYSLYCLTEEEIWKIYDKTMSSEDSAIFLLLYQCALRDHEVSHLRIEHIDWDQHVINLVTYKGSVKHKKTKAELTVPISDRCYEHLKHVKQKRTFGWLFQSKSSSDHINDKTINYRLAKWGKEAGVNNPIPKTKVNRFRLGNDEVYSQYININPHLLRHSGIRHYLDKGGDIRFASKLARHKNINLTINTYGVPSIKQRIEEFKRIIG